jgi:hypothetical protein
MVRRRLVIVLLCGFWFAVATENVAAWHRLRSRRCWQIPPTSANSKVITLEQKDRDLFLTLQGVTSGKYSVEEERRRFGLPTCDTDSPEPFPPICSINMNQSVHKTQMPHFGGASRVVYWVSSYQPGHNVEIVGLIWRRDHSVEVFRAQVLPP